MNDSCAQPACSLSNGIPIGKRNWDGFYLLENQPPVEIKLKSAKEVSNSITVRNYARREFTMLLVRFIDTIECHGEFLTPADKREFKEAFSDLLKEI